MRCSMCTQCPNPAALTGVCCPTWGQSFGLCHLCKAGQCPCIVTQSLVGSLTFRRSHCNVYVQKQSLHQLGGLWRLMPAGWGYIDLWPIFIVRGGIRSLSQSQGFAFSPSDSICAQSIPSLSVRAWPCCLPAQLINRTKNCWGFLSSPVSDMGFSMRWVVLTCAGFSLLMVQAHWLQDLQHRCQHLSDESHRGKAPDNTSGPRIMACTFKGSVTSLVPSEMFRLTSSLLEFRLPGHTEVLILSAHLSCQSWKTDVSWEEVERCEFALLVFSATTDCFKTVSQQSLVFGTDYGLLPARKWTQKCFPENDLTTLLQHLNSVVLLCYLYKTACGGINLIKCKYICRSYQKAGVSIGI